MHGPHAFASTTPPNSSNILEMPSRSMVALICSEPGVMAVVERLFGHTGRSAHVLIARVSAAADQTDPDVGGPSIFDGLLANLVNGIGEVGRKRSVHMRPQFVQVNLDHSVVLGARVGSQQVGMLAGKLGNFGPSCGRQVVGHALIERKDGRGRSDLGAHVANGAHACARNGVDAWSKVLDNGASASFDGQDAGQLQNNVFGRGPSAQAAAQTDSDHFGTLELPGQTGHHVDSVGASHADAQAAEAAAIRGVRVGADQQDAWEGVVL
ncbi:aconitate mitochondrial precursor [Brachionus plicatilis]|uniref:Aconitate mitochondrial n=1 Tax=Brachionus plicatilis TaxID=10195 RepID=A0A3M7R7R5_BRAPC|nr:aconitate mitochondrial precursor [Brachionus plicatilis]